MKLINLKAFVNKNNKQVSFNLPKGKMDANLRRLLRENPKKLKSLKVRIEGHQEW